MKKLALALLLGFGFVLSQAVAQEEELVEYIEEFEEVDEGAEGVNGANGDEYADETPLDDGEEYATEATQTPSDESDESQANAQEKLEPLDEGDEFADEGEDGAEYVEDTLDESEEYATEDDMGSEDIGGAVVIDGGDSSDITRWNYTEEEIANQEKKMQRKAERDAEYAKSITRKRSGIFFGFGMGFSNMNLNDLGGSIAAAALGGGELSISGIGVGGFAGYQQAFNEYSGIRAYGEFDYNLGNGIFTGSIGGKAYKADNTLWKALGNVDFYLEGSMGRNRTETVGFFFGLGAGYIYYKGGDVKENGTTVNYHSLHLIAMTVNWGLHTILGTHHRIELFVRNYPFVKAQTGANNTREFTSNIDAWLRYSYMF